MNGHLQLSINLKDTQQIKDALKLLENLLPLELPKPKPTGFYAVATKGDLVKLSTTKPRDKITTTANREGISLNWGKKYPLPLTKSEKARNAALKRKRDNHGHFVKQKK